jgi:hypothetical protein
MAASFLPWKDADPMLLDAAKAALPGAVVPAVEVLNDVVKPSSPVYIPVSADWVPPAAAGGHVPPVSQWFESDASEWLGTETSSTQKPLGQAAARAGEQRYLSPGYGGP